MEVPSQDAMRITTWNARGLNAPSKKGLIKQYLSTFKSKIILIQETKLTLDEGTKLDRLLRVCQSTYQVENGSAGGLALSRIPKK